MSKNTYTAYLPTEGVKWSALVAEAKSEARHATAHNKWDLDYVDEYHREVGVYNDHGKKVGLEAQAKVVLRKA